MLEIILRWKFSKMCPLIVISTRAKLFILNQCKTDNFLKNIILKIAKNYGIFFN